MKKVLSYIFIAPIITMLLCVNVLAETVYTEGALNYVIRNGTIVIVNYFGLDENVTIPSSINNTPVIEIASGAFTDSNAKNIIIPDTVVKIAEDAISKDVKYEIVDEYKTVTNDDKQEDIVDKDDEKEPKQEDYNPGIIVIDDDGNVISNVDNKESVDGGDISIDEINNDVVENLDVSIDDEENFDNTQNINSSEHIKRSNNIMISILYGFFATIIVFYIYKKNKK